MYCLILFYISLEDRLRPFRPLPKFFCVKFVIFFSFWQTCSLIMLWKFGFLTEQTSKFLQDMLICFEMVLAAIAHSYAFTYADFVDYSKIKNPIMSNLGQVLNVKDLFLDVGNTFINEKKGVTTTALSEFGNGSSDEDEAHLIKRSSREKKRNEHDVIDKNDIASHSTYASSHHNQTTNQSNHSKHSNISVKNKGSKSGKIK